LGVFALGIAMIRERAGSDEFINIAGQGRLQPWAALAIGIGGMSLAGLPGTVGFVSRWTTARVIGVHDLEALVLILVAGASVGVGMVRGLAALYADVPATSLDTEVTPISAARPNMRGRAALVTLAIALIIALGIAPGITESIIQPISSNYTFYK
jgi:multicomponent Na+:H+ antiporter subunit D